MNKKTLAIILSIALAIGAFAGLSFNLFSANATDYVGDGTNVAYNATGANTSTAAVFSANISTNYVDGTTEKKGANIVGIRATGAGQDGEGYYAKPNTASFTWSGSNNDWRNVTAFYFEYGNKITAGSGCILARVASEAAKNSLYGMEAIHGIPGSVGGAVFMNAGAYGYEMSQVVEYTEYVDKKGNVCRAYGDENCFGYRCSRFSDGDIVTSVCFSLEEGNSEEIYTKMADYAKRRRDSQPLEYPSAGSVFKRPEGYFAGKLIQDSEG